MTPSLVVRDTAVEDLPEIFRIKRHPGVAQHQYRFTDAEQPRWRALLSEDSQLGEMTFRCSTILWRRATLIGYITHLHYAARGEAVCWCGWDLDPDYWGRGLMPAALSRLFDDLFHREQVRYILADCFRGNQKCLRVLQKLGFVQNRLPLTERLLVAWRQGSCRWIQRWQVGPQTFRPHPPPSSVEI